MLRKELNNRLLNDKQKVENIPHKPNYTKPLNPYENIVVAPRKVMPSTVMNSREKLKAHVYQPQPPVTAQDVRGSKDTELQVEKQKSVVKSGGMSQMATTAPRNDDDYGYNSGGRITAELTKVLDSKQANQKLADQALTPQLFAKNNTKQRTTTAAAPITDSNMFQKRSVSVY